eukprot:COSAG02_NODE_2379_length_8997_cov_13.958193_4_plen_53_part_00
MHDLVVVQRMSGVAQNDPEMGSLMAAFESMLITGMRALCSVSKFVLTLVVFR